MLAYLPTKFEFQWRRFVSWWISALGSLTIFLPSLSKAQDKFAIIGDFGDTTAATNVANRILTMKPNWIGTVGDNIYTTGGTTAEFDAAIGIKYGAFIKGSASSTGTAAINNFYPVVGNHDIDAGGATLAQNYTDYFNLTTVNDAAISTSSGNERYYDVVRGNTHLFVLSSDTRDTTALGGGQEIGSPQRTWFDSQLAASTSPWNIVAFHHPAFSTAGLTGNQASNSYLQWGFSSGGNTAQVIYNGHSHDYERFLTTATGQQYVVEGSGGQSTGNFAQPPLTGATVTQFRDTSNPATINAQGGKSYNGFSIVDATSTYYTSKHFRENGEKIDEFTLLKSGSGLLNTTFRNGNANGYAGALDTQISQSAPNTNLAGSATITVDAADGSGLPSQVLMRFENLFGAGIGQIPFNAEIASATLNIEITNAGSGLSVYPMIANWSDTSTWNSLLDGVATDGIEAALAANFDATIGAGNTGESASTNVGLGTLSIDVTKSLQNWANGGTNNGWLFNYLTGGTNGIGIRSSEDATASLRPRLDVSYITAVPEPSAIILIGFSICSLSFRRSRSGRRLSELGIL